jgi:hypothetical protein
MPEQKFTGEEKGGFPRLQKSSALSLHHRIVIAFPSPRGAVETGLLICPAEKKAAMLASAVEKDTFSSPV